MSEPEPEPEPNLKPDKILFQCVGCGTMNFAGAEVCFGCGHHFGGKGAASPRDPIQRRPTPEPVSDRDFIEFRMSDDDFAAQQPFIPEESLARGFLKFLGWLLMMALGLVVAALSLGLALVIGFVVICGGGGNGQVVGIGFGIFVAGAVVVTIMNLLYRFLNDSPGPRPGKYR